MFLRGDFNERARKSSASVIAQTEYIIIIPYRGVLLTAILTSRYPYYYCYFNTSYYNIGGIYYTVHVALYGVIQQQQQQQHVLIKVPQRRPFTSKIPYRSCATNNNNNNNNTHDGDRY